MRQSDIVLAGFGVLLLGAVGYGFITNPAGCAKVGTDIVAVFSPPPPPPPAPVVKPATSKPLDKPPAAHPGPIVAAATQAKPGASPAPLPPPASAPKAEAMTQTPPPPPIVFKPWTPPEVMPAQPNWTWTTPDKTYENVVVTKIEPETVTITHSMGVAHIPIATLSPELQKQLSYDPVAAAAAKAEAEREETHPYYTLDTLTEAQNVARQLHWPLAWMAGHLQTLSIPTQGDESDLTVMALNYLKKQTIVIFMDDQDFAKSPQVLVNQGFFQLDDGVIPGGHHFHAPKIVFSDADGTQYLGRVSHTQLAASREEAIEKVLQSITAASAPPATNAPVAMPPSP